MSKRVVLIEPISQRFDFNYLPQGLLSIAAILRDAGFDVSVHGSLPIPYCDVLGISAATHQYIDALNIARKSTADRTVIGGAHVTTATADAMSCLFDYGVVGDGEDAFLSICNGVNPKSIPGVVYRDRDVLVMNPNREFTYRLRGPKLPLPAYELWAGSIGEHINVYRNREWSWEGGWSRRNRPKYWEWFSSEIDLLMDLGVRSVTITDENFGCWHQNIASTICALNKLDWWACRSGVKNFLSQELHKKLFGSRCRQIEIEMATASPRLLAEFYDYTVEDIDRVIKLSTEIGLETFICAVLGLPGETVDSMMSTWQWSLGKRVRFETMVPLPGTIYYEEPERFSQFGYEVVDDPHRIIDDDRIFWKMGTITNQDFRKIVEEIKGEVRNGRTV